MYLNKNIFKFNENILEMMKRAEITNDKKINIW